MKKIILLLLLISIKNTVTAQFHDNTTILGWHGGSIDGFIGLPDDSLDNVILTYPEGAVKVTLKKYLEIPRIFFTNSPFSDKNGNFSFVSNVMNVWDKNFKELKQGTTLTNSPLEVTQLNLTLPMPRNDNKAILIYGEIALAYFSTGKIDTVLNIPIDSAISYSDNLYYAEIKLNGANGAAEYISKGKIIIEDSLAAGKLTATRHANGRDWWILAPMRGKSSEYYKLLLTDKGLFNKGKQSVGTRIEDGIGIGSFSPNGKLYVRLECVDFVRSPTINIYDFDRCSGQLSNHRQIKNIYPNYAGIAISPNSRYLYSAEFIDAYQYDLQAPNIEKSKVRIATYDGFTGVSGAETNFFSMQLMPDRRIYCTSAYRATEYFHVIEKPDLAFPHCRFEQHKLKLLTRNFASVPNFPNYRLGPLDTSPCDTLGINNTPRAWYRYEKDTSNQQNIAFTDLSFYEPSTWSWDFGDGTPLSKEISPIHSFAKKENYKVCLTVSNQYGSHEHCKNINLGTSSTQNAIQADYVQVFPNPFKNKLYIALSEVLAQPIFNLYNNMGALLKSTNLYYGVSDLDTNDLSAGLYFWNISSKNQIMATGKVVKIE